MKLNYVPKTMWPKNSKQDTNYVGAYSLESIVMVGMNIRRMF